MQYHLLYRHQRQFSFSLTFVPVDERRFDAANWFFFYFTDWAGTIVGIITTIILLVGTIIAYFQCKNDGKSS